MPMVEDLSVFFSADEFATTATIGTEAVAGIFDRAYADPFGIASTMPTLTLPAARAAATVQGDAITIDGTAYRVRSVEPDGTGLTRLGLERAA